MPSSQRWGSVPYREGAISEVSVMWGGKKVGARVEAEDSEGRREGRVCVIRVVRVVWRG